MFWLDCQSNYHNVALHAVWNDLDKNCHFRGDLNIEVCLKLKRKNWLNVAAGQTCDQIVTFVFFSLGRNMFGLGHFFFQLHSLFDHTSLKHAHDFKKLKNLLIFPKIQIPVKLVQNVQILSNFPVEYGSESCSSFIGSF